MLTGNVCAIWNLVWAHGSPEGEMISLWGAVFPAQKNPARLFLIFWYIDRGFPTLETPDVISNLFNFFLRIMLLCFPLISLCNCFYVPKLSYSDSKIQSSDFLYHLTKHIFLWLGQKLIFCCATNLCIPMEIGGDGCIIGETSLHGTKGGGGADARNIGNIPMNSFYH